MADSRLGPRTHKMSLDILHTRQQRCGPEGAQAGPGPRRKPRGAPGGQLQNVSDEALTNWTITCRTQCTWGLDTCE